MKTISEKARHGNFPVDTSKWRIVVIVLCTLVSFFAVTFIQSGILMQSVEITPFQRVKTFMEDMNDNTLVYSIALVALYVFYRKAPASTHVVLGRVFSVVFSLVFLLIYAVYGDDRFSVLWATPFQVVCSLVVFVGVALLMYNLIAWASHLIRVCNTRFKQAPQKLEWFMKHQFVYSWIFIFVMWLPYMVLRYPAGIEYDAYYQILVGLGDGGFSAHHPPITTFLFSTFVKFGMAIGSTNVGIFVYILLQSAVCAAALAYMVKTISELKAPFWIAAACLLVCAIAPIYPAFMTSLVKDAIYTASVIVFCCLLVRVFVIGGGHSKQLLVALCVAGIMVCVCRKNGIGIIVVALLLALAVAVFTQRHDKRLFALFAGTQAIALAVFALYSYALLPAFNITPGPVQEALSLPFQQTARFVRDHADEVMPADEKAIKDVLDYKVLREAYNPRLADPIKGSYHGDTPALIRYFGTWLAQLIRHPETYAEAMLANTGGFLNPLESQAVCYPSLNQQPFEGAIAVFDDTSATSGQTRDNLQRTMKLLWSFPLVRFFCNTGIQLWIAILLIALLIRRKNPALVLIAIPSLVGILVCLISPTFTNFSMRYALPIIYANFLLLAVLCRDNASKKNQK